MHIFFTVSIIISISLLILWFQSFSNEYPIYVEKVKRCTVGWTEITCCRIIFFLFEIKNKTEKHLIFQSKMLSYHYCLANLEWLEWLSFINDCPTRLYVEKVKKCTIGWARMLTWYIFFYSFNNNLDLFIKSMISSFI